MKIFKTAFLAIVLSFGLSTLSQGAPIQLTVGDSWVNDSTWGWLNVAKYNYGSGTDHGDAIGYGDATSERGKWQGLGEINGTDYYGTDDGVKWSVGGSAFGTKEKLIIGEEVTFRFLFWQANNGNHTYDQIFAAFDFDQNKTWEADERILYEKLDTTNLTSGPRDDVSKTKSRYMQYEVSFVVPDTMTIGETWLRVRAHCNHVEYPNITAYNHMYWQGETEDYKLLITANPVPEPATLLLFGSGILGLAAVRRKRR